ncbi:Antitoxin component of toxin-antitoxin stability system, DNA-binding transcriptional repressor [Devosia lucknowensis]|uniref:Antitoxin component of toxin-antitoxin stability system, DNA-binding transcriptional repressor n=1 Tax=Devosia lucknowensis TaxID=1096929 RepID=A0A1Y6G9I7_9HYPH|nr:prevent-host-death protein [Devosia lucknowensis]SMQ86033.1 Antitoxin component of toxin-antitoxin stability system, DNA-binding transcriptional repressor [Devosia lucknowensis]
MKVSVKAAEANLSELIDAALSGEEVVIDKDSSTAVRIVPVQQSMPFKFGLLAGKVGEVPDFLEPMSEEDLAAWEGAA